MIRYKNLMETLVAEKYEQVRDSLGCCPCEACFNDVIACALNLLPNKYVVTRQGELYTKLDLLDYQYKADILAAITHAAKLVRKNPRHTTPIDQRGAPTDNK